MKGLDNALKTTIYIITMNHKFKELTDMVVKQAEEKGFGTKPEDINVAEKIALIHTEISEAFEAYRHRNMAGKDGFAEELADATVRIMHLCAMFGIDLEQEIVKKIEHNKDREWDWKNMNEKHA